MDEQMDRKRASASLRVRPHIAGSGSGPLRISTSQVKAAEADAESKYLSGMGVARQRAAIVDGLQKSIVAFSGEITETSPKDVMDLLLLTQYFDTLKDVGSNGGGKTLFLPHAPSAVGELQEKLRSGIMSKH